jgi:uncharacterized protein YdaU (DUF1376 family)
VQSLQSLSKGGDPHEVMRFLQLVGPAIAAHLQRFENDQTREGVHKQLTEQLKKISQGADKLKQALVKQSQEQKAQAQKQQQTMTDAQLKQAKAKSDIQLKQVKTQAQLKQSQEKHQLKMAQGVQDLHLKDATTAAEIHRNRIKAFAESSSDE